LAGVAAGEGKLQEARRYKQDALNAAERYARELFVGKALPASNTVTILGYRIDLSGFDLQLGQVERARELLGLSVREAERVRSLRGLDQGVKSRLSDAQDRMDLRRSELWTADLFKQLDVGLPGPPPRSKAFAVSGKVTLDGQPLPGVEVVLVPAG